MARIVFVSIYALAAAFGLDLAAYCFFGRSLSYCPAEGSCDGWLLSRVMVGFALVVLGGLLHSNHGLDE